MTKEDRERYKAAEAATKAKEREEAERHGGVVIVTGNDHTREKAGFDEVEHAPWTVVMPPFFDEHSGASVVQRFDKGTMHPKLHLLEFGGPTADACFLRVVIASANLGDYEGGLNNQVWHTHRLTAHALTHDRSARASVVIARHSHSLTSRLLCARHSPV